MSEVSRRDWINTVGVAGVGAAVPLPDVRSLDAMFPSPHFVVSACLSEPSPTTDPEWHVGFAKATPTRHPSPGARNEDARISVRLPDVHCQLCR